jgi:hypothetical protein
LLNWEIPPTYVVDTVDFVGLIPKILLFALGNESLLLLAQLSGVIVLLGWILVGFVLWGEAVMLVEGKKLSWSMY